MPPTLPYNRPTRTLITLAYFKTAPLERRKVEHA